MKNDYHDIYFMRHALELAKKAAAIGEVPVGCIIVANNNIIATEFNRRETDRDPTSHAELLALRSAAGKRPSWRLDGCDLYVTLEPCLMCAGAMIQARVRRLIFGAADPKGGMAGTVMNAFELPANHKVQVTGFVLAEECGRLLKEFFLERR
ncbi:MAG TPA: nucleoside deaminase [Clostridiaceae bacterium]|nr:nucleoside deaminase [Clostridiaceae bacterium]